MDHKSFSARFRRSNRKIHGTSSRGASPVSAPSPPTSTTPPEDADGHNDDGSSKPTANRAAPPVLTITTTNTPPRSSHGESHSLFHPPKSPFRNFHFRSSNKRARSPAPAAFSQPSSPAVVKQNGTAEHEMMSPAKTPAKAQGSSGANGEQQMNAAGLPSQPRIPAFLAMTEEEILGKYSEITWSERNRILQAAIDTSPSHKFARVDGAFRMFDRYNNIQPYNNNRVKLRVPEGFPDYINASPIILHSPLAPKKRRPHRYIAMQGPLEKTSEHVWRMVSDQLESPAVMVMLTETYENNAEKCYPYFPHNINETMEVGERDEFKDGFRAQVKCASIELKADGAIEMRKLTMHVEGRGERDIEIWHLLYKKWPDFGVPALEDINSFFELMRLSREKNASEDNPRVVHCSAGVGRSGTFIALEHLMREIDSGDLERYDEEHGANAPDLVYDTVNQLREQRKMMVQAELQYVFIYQVLRKQWMEKYGIEDDIGGERSAKRLEVGTDPFVEDN